MKKVNIITFMVRWVFWHSLATFIFMDTRPLFKLNNVFTVMNNLMYTQIVPV